MSITNNIISLQNLLNIINTLPEAGGIELPILTNEGTTSELFDGKELIDQNGNIITGTFNISNELNIQDNLITQIQNVLANKTFYNTIYIGTTEPTANMGTNGDIYIVRGEA